MRSVVMIIFKIQRQNAFEVTLVQHDDAVCTFSPDRADYPFNKRVLPRSLRGRDYFFDAHVFHLVAKKNAIDRIPASHQIGHGSFRNLESQPEQFSVNPGRVPLGLAEAIFLTRSRISLQTRGLPGPLDLNFQESLNPLWCQRTTVSGLTMTRASRQEVQIRESTNKKSRSTARIFGRLFVHIMTASCWRSARFLAERFEVILIFDHINETRISSVFIMV